MKFGVNRDILCRKKCVKYRQVISCSTNVMHKKVGNPIL